MGQEGRPGRSSGKDGIVKESCKIVDLCMVRRNQEERIRVEVFNGLSRCSSLVGDWVSMGVSLCACIFFFY